jgi:hypothetical protein
MRPAVTVLYQEGQGTVDPAGGGLRAQVLGECHDGPLGGHFDRAKTGSLVRRLALWVGQDVDVAEYVRTCQTCQRTKAEHGGPRGLLHPLPLPSRRGGMIGVDWIAGLPTTEGGFGMIRNHVDLLSGKVHAVPTRATATAAEAAEIIRDMCLRPDDATTAEVLAGAALVGRSILYRWPGQGWVLGKVVRVSRAAGFSHVVRYARGSALGVGVVASLLDAPSHGPGPADRWVLLCPA